MVVSDVTQMIKGGKKMPKKVKRSRPKTDHGKIQKLSKELSLVKKGLKQTVEIKNFDQITTAATATAVGNDYGSGFNMFAPTQAVGQNSRVGDSCFVTNMDLRFRLTNVDPAVIGQCRVIVWIDEDNALAATSLLNTVGLINTVGAPLAFYNRYYRRQFTILYDELFDLDATQSSQQTVRVNLPINKEVSFQAANTNILQNSIKILFVSNVTAASADILYQYTSRIYFKDS